MFNTLLKLPLFQGLSQEDFTNILARVRLHFTKYRSGEIVVKSNSQGKGLIFLLKGEIESEISFENKPFTYIETVRAPYLIEPEALFGMNPYIKASYIARSEVNVMTIDKISVLNELFKYDVFRLNYVNNVGNRAQALHSRLWKTPSGGTMNKVIHLIFRYAERPEGEKAIRVKMEDLAEILDETRLNVSKALNELQNRKLIQLKRKMIYIPEISKLLP